jgi:predicted nucleotide-binding protein
MTPASELHEELLEIADRLDDVAKDGDTPEIKEPLERLEDAATTIGKAWSGSYIGYHARTYYRDLKPPPPGDHFSQEWGMMRSWASQDTGDDWVEYDPDEVQRRIRAAAGNPGLGPANELAVRAERCFEDAKSEVLSILTTAGSDGFISAIREQVEETGLLSGSEVSRRLLPPSGHLMSRDMLALNQGVQLPPHLKLLAEVVTLRQAPTACARLAELARKAGSHMARLRRRSARSREIGTNVFIGHGKSPIWRELKDFIQDRLRLPWDEFNRVPVAGVTNVARLAEMLNAASIAFLVMTGEDELADGKLHARMNVVHEAGLFQGRLGFTRAIVLLEHGCEEFGNIEGLGQIRFPKGNIRAAFDEVRQVLEREGLVEPT